VCGANGRSREDLTDRGTWKTKLKPRKNRGGGGKSQGIVSGHPRNKKKKGTKSGAKYEQK